MNKANKFFEYLEDLILGIIAIMTVAAVGFELFEVYNKGTIGLADLLLMFIYAEVLGMVAIYFRSHVLPVIYPLFIGITALARFIILQDKDSDPTNLIYISVAILIVALATVIIRFRNSKYLKIDKSKSNEL